jgi:integrase
LATYRKKLHADGTAVWHVQIRKRGFPPLTETFARISDARAWVQQVETRMRERRFFPAFRSQQHTAGEMIDRFVRERLPEGPTQRRDLTSHLAWWKAEIGRYLLSELTPSVLSAACNKLSNGITVRRKKRAPATVLRIMASLAAVLKVAERNWEWIESSPMAKISKPRAARGRVRYLSADERNRLLKACLQSQNPYLYTIVVIALSTGMRLGEIMGLRWELVDVRPSLSVGHAQLLDTKNGESRGVPIAGAALASVRVLAGLQGKTVGLLFPSERLEVETPMNIRRPWEAAVAAAKLKDFRFHDLRHSAAAALAMNGATDSEMAAVLGHKTLAMVKRYAHISEAHTPGVVARMNEAVFPTVDDRNA